MGVAWYVSGLEKLPPGFQKDLSGLSVTQFYNTKYTPGSPGGVLDSMPGTSAIGGKNSNTDIAALNQAPLISEPVVHFITVKWNNKTNGGKSDVAYGVIE